MIFAAIAGSTTPIVLIAVPGAFGIVLIALVWAASFAVIGIVLAALYILIMYQRTMTGPLREDNRGVHDLEAREITALAPALVLIIGVLVSMFSAIVVTRSIMRVIVRRDWARNAQLFGMRPEEFVAVTSVRPSRRPVRADA